MTFPPRNRGMQQSQQLHAPTVEDVKRDPKKGDLLCFDGREWKVARREWRQFEVPDPNTQC